MAWCVADEVIISRWFGRRKTNPRSCVAGRMKCPSRPRGSLGAWS